MATNIRSWGILGNPSKEKIEEYKSMPVGSFKSMITRLNRTKKGKKMQEYTIYVTKRNITATRGIIKVNAFDFSEAAELARLNKDQVVWDAEPYKTNYDEFTHSNMDPLTYRT